MSSIDFKALFERSPNPYMVLDRDLRYVAANPAYLTAVAARLEDLLGVFVFDAFPHDADDPDNASARLLRESLERVLATGQPDVLPLIVYRVPFRTPTGVELRERYWRATHTPICDPAGRVTHILEHAVDVTDVQALQHRLEAAKAIVQGVWPLEPAADVIISSALTQLQAAFVRRAAHVQSADQTIDSERRNVRSLFDRTLGFVAFLSGNDHVFALANPAYYDLVGKRDLIGRPIREALPEIADQGFIELLDRVVASAEPFVGRGMRVRLQREPGAPLSEALIDVVYQPIIGPEGAVTGIFVQGHDITTQRLAERDRERLATIVEQSDDIIGVAAIDGQMLYLNVAGQALLGLPADRIASTSGAEFFMPEDLAFVTDTIYPALLATGHWEGNFRYRHFETGEPIAIHYNLFTIIDAASGTIDAFASVSHDLRKKQEQEQAIAALAGAERAARAVINATQAEHSFLADAIPDHVWTASPSGALTHVNRRVTTYLGRPAEQVIREGWQAVVHPEDLEHFSSLWMVALQAGTPYECEVRLLRASDQSYRWHIARALSLRDEHGEVIKWYGSNSDIEVLKRTERERDELIVALSASNLELDQFAYVASHDLKAPLRGIANLAQWIEADLGDSVSPETREHLTMMQRRVMRMDALVDGVLNYARAGRSSGGVIEVDVAAMLADIIELFAPRPNVHIYVGPGMPRVQTVAVALQQVFMNLIGNAIKHARREDARVEIAVSERRLTGKSDRRMYRFTVSDNGPGVEPRFHERIWGLFQVLQPRDEVEGSGIGLSVVKKLVEARGGEVGVESELGKGATFWFTWPSSSS